MSSLRNGAAAVWLLLAAIGVAVAAPRLSCAQERQEAYSFVFRDADVAQVVDEVLGANLKIAYTIDPSVTGKMSFRIDQRLTRAQLYEALEATLATNNVVMVQEGESVRVTSRAKAKGAAGVRTVGDGSRGRAGYDVLAVPISFVAPSEVAKALEAMSGSNLVLYVNDKQGLIILGGVGSELDAAQETIKVFDRSAFEGARIRWFDLRQVSATTAASELERLLQAGGMTAVTVVPMKRLNGLVVLARTAAALNEVGGWVQRLDVAAPNAGLSLWVYHPRSASAETLGVTLANALGAEASVPASLPATTSTTSSVGGASPAASSVTLSKTAGSEGEDGVRVSIDKDSNALLIFASQSRWLQIQKTLDEIDRPASQVMIEASILEVTLSKDLQFGVDWQSLGASGKLTASSIYNDSAAVAPTYPGFSITYLSGDIKAAINALGSKTDVEVVSAPKIVTLDKKAAKLEVGDQVPIVTQSSQSTASGDAALVNTVDYRNTGVILNVTPRITGDRRVVLDVAQEVSSVAKTVTSGIDSPTIQQRKLESTLVLADGAVVALGGLISRSRTKSDSGVPWLRDVPAIGSLFKSQSHDETRTELIVLLSAKIITDPSSAGRAMDDLYADMRELKTRGMLPDGQ
ncbi:type II secretion system protein GspD [Caulobacter sp. D4A]|uniref:type II secretion system secretin GspD n=1 Tax=unclassified Caulobacter TaxID=2648921 RepID=UPI000D73432F|nr:MULTISPECIES: type II secretion system secretin GspD [unclassified Caulobacter]PXA95302.1 type II secretion system protein GspD [Caulobacter sp. D4A]PXA95613.1 type II secretion system protein GspD [Caulobacter sp. D5]